MGKLMMEMGLQPDVWWSSTAVRARTTAEIVADCVGFTGEIQSRPELYHADADTFIETLKELDDSTQSVLIVGHNPGLEELLELLTTLEESLPTAALALIELPIDHWRDIDATTHGTLLQIRRPKELQ